MARLSTVAGIKESGWALMVGAEFGDVEEFLAAELELIRKEAPGKMRRAVAHILRALRQVLSRQYPIISQAGAAFTTRSGTTSRRGRTRRQPSAPGDPPGYISGDLSDSWLPGRLSWTRDKMVLTGRYESRHPAAGRLERGDPGTRTGRPLPARPYQRVALLAEADALSRILDGT